MQNLAKDLFSFSGRLSRGRFLKIWLWLTIASILALLVAIALGMRDMRAAAIGVMALCAVIVTLGLLGPFMRRLRDRGLPGWLALVSFGLELIWLPLESYSQHVRDMSPTGIAILIAILASFVFQLWLLVETFLRKGQPGANKYGPDPLELEA